MLYTSFVFIAQCICVCSFPRALSFFKLHCSHIGIVEPLHSFGIGGGHDTPLKNQPCYDGANILIMFTISTF